MQLTNESHARAGSRKTLGAVIGIAMTLLSIVTGWTCNAVTRQSDAVQRNRLELVEIRAGLSQELKAERDCTKQLADVLTSATPTLAGIKAVLERLNENRQPEKPQRSR